jgi:stress response protein YsnF
MTPDPGAPDRPFPGARSQVPGARHEPATAAAPRDPDARRPASSSLPLESAEVRSDGGWSVRLPVRAEQISVDKQVVVYERVQVRRHDVQDQARLQSSVRTEELRLAADGNARVSPAP